MPITKTEGVCGGVACIDGTRIPVHIIESWRRQGADDYMLLDMYPRLTIAQLRAAEVYAAEHRAEIKADIRRNEEA